MVKPIRQLLTIEAWEYTGEQILDFRKDMEKYARNFDGRFDDNFPMWCVTKENHVTWSASYLQFIRGPRSAYTKADLGEKYTVFSEVSADQPLSEEIAQVGMDWVFKSHLESVKYFSGLSDKEYPTLPQIFNKLYLNKGSDRHRVLPARSHLVLDARYWSDGEDADCSVMVVGYLNQQLELVFL